MIEGVDIARLILVCLNNVSFFLFINFCDVGQISVNAKQIIPYPWLVFNEKIKIREVLIRDSTCVSDSMLILFGGALDNGIQVIS